MRVKFGTCILQLLLLIISVKAAIIDQRNKRAAIGDREGLWTNGIVYYSFSSSISPRLQRLLEEAMTEWQNATCLQFLPRDKGDDYVKFYSHPNVEYCTCDSVGRRGGEQVIKLGYSCQTKGELLHTVGHVIGLWHEQARPDRDKYVRIINENIEEGQEKNFKKRNEFTIDYQGTDYDFGSIMHLDAAAYSKNGYDTTVVLREYKELNEDIIGQREELSNNDKKQVNTLYNCPSQQVNQGVLRVSILNITIFTLQNPNPHVEITAVDSNGDEMVMYTAEKKIGQNDVKTQQIETIEFPVHEPKDWQFFRIRITSATQENSTDKLAVSRTVHIVPSEYKEFRYCIGDSQNCDEYLEYGYEYIEDGDECSRDPCVYGNCTDLFVGFECNCSSTSYYGELCQYDRCESMPCQNEGMCELDSTNIRGYTCNCNTSYYGDHCQFDRCSSSPCQNNGICELDYTVLEGYTCCCHNARYYGLQCDRINYCYPNLCKNGGRCEIESSNSHGYICNCTNRYYGDQCQHTNYCYPNPCQNSGRCQLSSMNSRGYTCTCSSSYYGDQCRFNRCDTSPCQNGGACQLSSSSWRGYTCSCGNSYYGDQCERNRCDSNPCRNSGTCQLYPTNSRGYMCNCSSYHYGDQCQYINYCYPNPCRNGGSCSLDSTNSRGYSCSCQHGYYGNQCQYIDACVSSPCRNSGMCIRSSNSYSCSCQHGYYGSQCQYIDACVSSPCRNSGTCRRSSNSYSCSCGHGYYGNQCQYIDACVSSPCRNSGTCRRSSNSYSCSCGHGYYGNQCQYVDSCASSPCQNSGRCTRSYSSYSCSCRSGYTGDNCEQRIGRLRLYFRYGSGLPDKDSWFAGDSDPYVKVRAYDSDGNYRSKETDYDWGDESPTWYEWLDFGTGTWTSFRVRVYDSDIGSDDTLSSWVSYDLDSFISRDYETMYCYSGYIVFDYEFES